MNKINFVEIKTTRFNILRDKDIIGHIEFLRGCWNFSMRYKKRMRNFELGEIKSFIDNLILDRNRSIEDDKS